MDSDPNRNVGCTDLSGKSDAPENRSNTRRDPSRCRTVLRHGYQVTSAGRPRNKRRTGSGIPSESRNTGRNL